MIRQTIRETRRPKLGRTLRWLLPAGTMLAWSAPGRAADKALPVTGEVPWVLLAVLLVVTGLLGLLFVKFRKPKPGKLLSRAHLALERGKSAKAKKLYARVVALLQDKDLEAAERRWLQEAHRGLGEIEAAATALEAATDHYQQAVRQGLQPAELPPGGLTLLAHRLAQAQTVSDPAVDLYLAYLDLKPKPQDARAVIGALAGVGLFADDAPQSRQAQAVRVAQAVLSVDVSQEWAQYSLGAALVTHGRADRGLPHLLAAGKLGSTRPLLYYWIGQGCRLKREPHPQGARNALEKFLEQSQIPEEMRHRGLAAFSLGASLLEPFGPAWSLEPPDPGDRGPRLGEAVAWLERALAEGKADGETYYHLGRGHFLRRQYFDAESALTKAVAADPAQATYCLALGMVCQNIGEKAEAEVHLLRAVNLDSAYQEAHLALAQLYTEDQRWPEVEAVCRQLLDLDGGPEVLGLLIQALYHQGDYETVIAQADAFRPQAKAPAMAPQCFMVARAYALTGNFQEAVGWYELAWSLEPTPEAAYHRVCALGHLDRYAEALEAVEPLLHSEHPLQFAAYLTKGHLCLKAGNQEAARAAYQGALDLSPRSTEALYGLGVAVYQQADLAGAGDFFAQVLAMDDQHQGALLGEGLIREAQTNQAEALSRYSRLLDLNPRHPIALERAAVLSCKQGDFIQALEWFKKLGARMTASGTALYFLGLTLIHTGDLKMAYQAWGLLFSRQPQALSPAYARLQYLLGQRYLEEERLEKTATLWRDYLTVFGDDQVAKQGLAEVYWRQAAGLLNGDAASLEQAREALNQAVELEADNRKFRYYEALLELARGNLAGAREALSRLVEIDPGNPRLEYHLGLVARRQGELPEAMRDWQLAAGHGPGNDYSLQAMFCLANEQIGQGAYQEAADLLHVALQSPGPIFPDKEVSADG
jgi:tetratricopeptide (TPR) repeat protein